MKIFAMPLVGFKGVAVRHNMQYASLLERMKNRRAMYFVPWAFARLSANKNESESVAELVAAYDSERANEYETQIKQKEIDE